MNITKKLLHVLMGMVMLSFLATASAVFAQAATVAELTGTATAVLIAAPGAPASTAGRALRKGDTVNQGETIKTGADSSMVLRFTDGQIAALTSNSTMAINNYVYNTAEPAKSNVLLSLLNGGMRAITGLIGKARPQAVAYRAGNATIGIRGTDVSIAAWGGNLVVNVELGLITLNVVGDKQITIQAGQAAFSTKDGKLITGDTKAVAKAIAEAMVANQGNQAVLRALSVMAGALVAVSPPGSNMASDMNAAVAATGLSKAIGWTGNVQRNVGNISSVAGTTTSTVTGASGSGGGGTLPLCSTIVSPTVAKPGTNCRTS